MPLFLQVMDGDATKAEAVALIFDARIVSRALASLADRAEDPAYDVAILAMLGREEGARERATSE